MIVSIECKLQKNKVKKANSVSVLNSPFFTYFLFNLLINLLITELQYNKIECTQFMQISCVYLRNNWCFILQNKDIHLYKSYNMGMSRKFVYTNISSINSTLSLDLHLRRCLFKQYTNK